MKRSQARPPAPAPLPAESHTPTLSPARGRRLPDNPTPGLALSDGGAGEGRAPGAEPGDGKPAFRPAPNPTESQTLGLVGAYWRGSKILARFRSPSGALTQREVPVEHSFFLRLADLDREVSGASTVEAALRRSRAFLALHREGEWARIVLRDRDALEGVVGPTGWARRVGVETFEGDLHPIKRWMLAESVKVGRPRRVYLDTEAYLPEGMQRFDRGRLLCWSIVDDADEEVATVSLENDDADSERYLLEGLLAALAPFDQVLAWNGDRFDFEFLRARAEAVGLDVEWRRWLLLDHMVLCKRMNVSASKSGEEKQSFALANWAAHVLGEKKQVDLGEGAHVAWKMWLAGGAERQRLASYCRDDAGKMARIEAKTGFVELHQSICEAAGVLPSSRTIGPMQIVETFAMRLGRARGMRFPTFSGYEGGAKRTDGDEDTSKLFDGAFVLQPTRLGIIENVHVCDFSRLYPSIAQTWNLSPETLYKRAIEVIGQEPPADVCVAPGSGHWFKREPRGLLPFVFDELLRQRAVWDDKKKALPPGSDAWNDADRRSTAYKNMTNAAFGVTGSRWSRLFQVEVAESMTLAGASLIKRVISEGERQGIETIAGDTDSAFCVGVLRPEFEAFIARLNRDVFPELARSSGAAECRIKLAYEKAFERVVYVSAKRYAARWDHFKGQAADEDAAAEVKGLEFKRGDTSRLARAMQAEVLDLLLGGGALPDSKRRPRCESDPAVFLKLVTAWRDRIINRELKLTEIVMSKRLSKEPEQYVRKLKKDGTFAAYQPQVRAAIMARDRGKDVGAGVRVEYVVADAREKELILAEDYDGTNVDRAHLWESLVYPATMRVLQACFPSTKWEAWRTVRKHLGKPGQVRLFEY